MAAECILRFGYGLAAVRTEVSLCGHGLPKEQDLRGYYLNIV